MYRLVSSHLMDLLRKGSADLDPRADEASHHRANGNVERVGDLLVLEFAHGAHQEDGPVEFAQLGQRVSQRETKAANRLLGIPEQVLVALLEPEFFQNVRLGLDGDAPPGPPLAVNPV